jgi:hypothetical protein
MSNMAPTGDAYNHFATAAYNHNSKVAPTPNAYHHFAVDANAYTHNPYNNGAYNHHRNAGPGANAYNHIAATYNPNSNAATLANSTTSNANHKHPSNLEQVRQCKSNFVQWFILCPWWLTKTCLVHLT